VNRDALIDLYRTRASKYDSAVAVYRLLGLREKRYRRDSVEALCLKTGDTVVDLACGTGLNFSFLEEAIKPEGKIIGVDFTDAMLDKAHERVLGAGWRNVELVQADIAEYIFPSQVAGVLSAFAICLLPEIDDPIRRAAAALRPGGRLAILDIKSPDAWPDWMARFIAWINRPFGVSVEATRRQPWQSIERYLTQIRFREYYFGYLYLSVGQATVS
jgi:demethylmenaquinone methyltransferase/2-methoxy-6-polyprenyl-1,4-benzoquinol methylase